MNLRSSVICSHLLSLDLRLECGPEQRESAIPADPPEPRFDVEERRGEPPLLLVGGPPGGDLGCPVPDEGVDRFQAVRGLHNGGRSNFRRLASSPQESVLFPGLGWGTRC